MRLFFRNEFTKNGEKNRPPGGGLGGGLIAKKGGDYGKI
jgi:hypothetical protein